MDMQFQFLTNGVAQAEISPQDRGIAFGDGVFRTMRIRGGIVDCWDLHYQHLSRDAAAIGITCPPAAIFMDDIAKLAAGVDNGVVKIILTRGASGRGYAIPASISSTRIVSISALPIYADLHYQDGVELHLCRMRMAIQPRLAGIKHLNRLENVLARMEWSDSQRVDGLMLDMDGNVVECTASNIFIRRGNVLITPDLTRCGVAGVTRLRIMNLAPELGYEVEIGQFGLQTLVEADEVLICNSLFGVWQVRCMEQHRWPKGDLASRLRAHLMNHDLPAA